MTKQTNAEAAVRSAAEALDAAIVKARAAGLVVAWPSRPEGLSAIAISETGKAKVSLTVQTDDLPPAVAAKTVAAAQKAADKVVEKATEKASDKAP
jgi:hypothetical protein